MLTTAQRRENLFTLVLKPSPQVTVVDENGEETISPIVVLRKEALQTIFKLEDSYMLRISELKLRELLGETYLASVTIYGQTCKYVVKYDERSLSTYLRWLKFKQEAKESNILIEVAEPEVGIAVNTWARKV